LRVTDLSTREHFACDPCECGGSDDCRQCNPLTMRELAELIVAGKQAWADSDAVEVAKAYLALEAPSR
jgi:hypothetical protein